jgi:hypothetical protein
MLPLALGGRAGFSQSAEIDYLKPAYGSIQVSEDKFFWAAWRRLRDWRDGESVLDSGFHTNEVTAHDLARATVRPYLSHLEPLPPLPETFIRAHYDRVMMEKLAQEQAARWLARVEDDGSIGGYSWEDVCEESEFDLIELALNPDGDDTVDIDATDEDEAKAA